MIRILKNTDWFHQKYIDASCQTDKVVENANVSAESLCQDEEKLKFYTGTCGCRVLILLSAYSCIKSFPGITEWCIFNALLNLLSPCLRECRKLSKYQMLLLFLMKLRLSLFNEDLAYRFGVHTSTVTRVFHSVLDVAKVRLSHLIKWPDRETLQKTMPMCFQKVFQEMLHRY